MDGTPAGAAPILVANVADAGVAELVARLEDWPGRLVPVALLEGSPGHPSGYARGIAAQYRTALGGVAGVVIARDWLRWARRPIDGGLELGGRRLFGDNKTWRGVVVVVPASAAFAALQARIDAGSLAVVDWQRVPAAAPPKNV